jgi:hypothetical protein
MTKRSRHRTRPSPPPAADPLMDAVADQAQELGMLWQIMPAALARDTAGPAAGSDRQPTGGSKGSGAGANLEVIEIVGVVEPGVHEFAAEAVQLLRLDPRKYRDTQSIIDAIPDWHRALAAAGYPLARHLRADLKSWLGMVRRAIGMTRRDQMLGAICPNHRDTRPTDLRQVGAEAVIARSLLNGPPPVAWRRPGPTCVTCDHDSCDELRRLHTKAGRSDWQLIRGVVVWRSLTSEPAFTWRSSAEISCPFCKQTWSTLTERRLLAAQLAALGDERPNLEMMT